MRIHLSTSLSFIAFIDIPSIESIHEDHHELIMKILFRKCNQTSRNDVYYKVEVLSCSIQAQRLITVSRFQRSNPILWALNTTSVWQADTLTNYKRTTPDSKEISEEKLSLFRSTLCRTVC